MDEPGWLPFRACRTVPTRDTVTVRGIDLTGADFHGAVRLYPGAPGNPVIDLPKVVTAGAKGLRLVSVDTTGPYPVSKLELCIPITSAGIGAVGMAPVGQPDPVQLAWDMILNPSDGRAFRVLAGSFTVVSGVAQL